MSATDSTTQQTFVLGLHAVRWGVQRLLATPIHGFFIAYLELRRQGVEQETATVQPDWHRLDDYLAVPGGPPGKPWFRPFWDQARNANQDWMRRHPAGSYNPTAIRPGTPGARVLGSSGGKHFTFPDDHWKLARQHLLHDKKLPVIPLALFLYRNYGFVSTGMSPHPTGLIDIFRTDFRYRPDAHDAEFAHMYDESFPERDDWFEPLQTDTDPVPS